jgi:hypothetical protein
MDKDDFYFAVGTLLAVLAFFGLDWKFVKGRFWMPHLTRRETLFFFLLLASVILSGVGWYKSSHRDLLHWRMQPADEELVYGKHFRNESVELDGKRFDHCTFENVTMIYHGLAPMDFVETSFKGNVFIKTDNQAAQGYMKISEWIKSLPNFDRSLGVTELDDKGNVLPLLPGPPKQQ